MTRQYFYKESKFARNAVNSAIEKVDALHECEEKLVRILSDIDQNRFFIRAGYKSLTGFCINVLLLSKTQTQRIVTKVRRYEPTSNIGEKGSDSDNRNFINRFATAMNNRL